jgi:hypothetical protein
MFVCLPVRQGEVWQVGDIREVVGLCLAGSSESLESKKWRVVRGKASGLDRAGVHMLSRLEVSCQRREVMDRL